jgi:hypothetical protein
MCALMWWYQWCWLLPVCYNRHMHFWLSCAFPLQDVQLVFSIYEDTAWRGTLFMNCRLTFHTGYRYTYYRCLITIAPVHGTTVQQRLRRSQRPGVVVLTQRQNRTNPSRFLEQEAKLQVKFVYELLCIMQLGFHGIFHKMLVGMFHSRAYICMNFLLPTPI